MNGWLSELKEMKYCKRCKIEKPVSEFNFKSKKFNRLQVYCKDCQAIYNKNHYLNNAVAYKDRAFKRNDKIRNEYTQKILGFLLKNPCVDCGEADPIVLDFDHTDPALKISSVSQMVLDAYSWEKIEEEINKCKIRCANCHRRRTAKQINRRMLKFIGV